MSFSLTLLGGIAIGYLICHVLNREEKGERKARKIKSGEKNIRDMGPGEIQGLIIYLHRKYPINELQQQVHREYSELDLNSLFNLLIENSSEIIEIPELRRQTQKALKRLIINTDTGSVVEAMLNNSELTFPNYNWIRDLAISCLRERTGNIEKILVAELNEEHVVRTDASELTGEDLDKRHLAEKIIAAFADKLDYGALVFAADKFHDYLSRCKMIESILQKQCRGDTGDCVGISDAYGLANDLIADHFAADALKGIDIEKLLINQLKIIAVDRIITFFTHVAKRYRETPLNLDTKPTIKSMEAYMSFLLRYIAENREVDAENMRILLELQEEGGFPDQVNQSLAAAMKSHLIKKLVE